VTLLYKANPVRGLEWQHHLAAAAPDLPFRMWPDIGDPADIRFMALWQPPDTPLSAFPNLEIVFSVGAGVDQFDIAAIPDHVPLVRMLEPGIAEAMIDYVTFAVLGLHRDLVAYIDQQRTKVWRELGIRPAGERRVGILGLGQLGQAVIPRLRLLGFDVAGWNRSPREIPDVRTYAGPEALPAFLGRTDILICLLPLTAETRGSMNAAMFAALPAGAALLNVGRGGHLVDADLIAALDSGHLAAAILDVAEPEPPAPDHPFWTHPKILLTPHVASNTRPETGVAFVLDTIARHRRGDSLPGQVDRTRGY
jgi:glyoxylate/hydroxypyruvate reductase A